MATAQLNGVIRHLRRMAQASDLGAMSDGKLLEFFLARQDEAAFDALVRRLGPMVLGVCRRVLRDRHDAEDAFQSVFLILLRKAHAITRPELIGNWLYGVAFYTAQNARVRRARRRAAEGQVPIMAPSTACEPSLDLDLPALLDQELSRLPEKYRTPVVLCELQGLSRQEAARRLRCPEGTLSSRLARARQMLRGRLERRGVVLSAAALASVLTPGLASASVPAALVGNTVKAAMSIAAGQAVIGVVSAPVAALTEGVLKAMFLTKLQLIVAVGLILGLLVGGAGFLTCQALAEKPAAVEKKEAAAAADKQDKKEKGPSVHGTVRSVDAGKNNITVIVPVEGTKQTESKTFPLTTDVKVLIADVASKTTPPAEGKLTDLTEDTIVSLQFSADKKTVEAITARGPGMRGAVKSVDAAKNTITLTPMKSDKNAVEQTVELTKDARITLSDGLKKSDKAQEGKLSDLTEGTPINVQLSVNRRQALAVQVLPGSIRGQLKGVDIGNNTITIIVKEDAQVVEKSFTLDKEVRSETKLTDLTADTQVVLQLSVFDKKKVVVIHTVKEKK